MPGLGRRYAPDERDRRFLLREVTPVVRALPDSIYYPIRQAPLDQGNTGTCVGHGWRHFLQAAPIMTRNGPTALDIYDGAIVIDEWDDNDVDPDRQFGTSVRAAVKVLQKLGHIAEYRWAWSADEMRRFLLSGGGPVVVGTTWYEQMMSPEDGFIKIGGSAVGGHAYLIIGCDFGRRNAFRILNSWGRSWGENGRAWIHFDEMERLIKDDGEVACATEQKLSPAS
jgi:hypothetical protein